MAADEAAYRERACSVYRAVACLPAPNQGPSVSEDQGKVRSSGEMDSTRSGARKEHIVRQERFHLCWRQRRGGLLAMCVPE